MAYSSKSTSCTPSPYISTLQFATSRHAHLNRGTMQNTAYFYFDTAKSKIYLYYILMATHFLCVRASELAEAIGRQKHTEPYQALERIWRRVDNAGYTHAYRRNSKQTEEEQVQAIFEANPQVAEIFATADVTQIDTSHSTITTAGDAINAVCARSELSTEDKLMLSERDLPPFLKPKPKYYYYYEWMRKRIEARHPQLTKFEIELAMVT
jgi:hypothetical protein